MGIRDLFGPRRPTVREVWDAAREQERLQDMLVREQSRLSNGALKAWDAAVGGRLVFRPHEGAPHIRLPDGKSMMYCQICAPLFQDAGAWYWQRFGIFGDGRWWSCVLCASDNSELASPAQCQCCALPRYLSTILARGLTVEPRLLV